MRAVLAAMLTAVSLTAAIAQPADPNSLPALSQPWRGPDYLTAAAAFRAGRAPLPAAGSALLARITASENLALAKNESLPLQTRLVDVAQMLQGLGILVILYGDAVQEGKNVHGELAATVAYAIRASGLACKLTTEFLPTIPRDESYAARMQGLARMQAGLSDVMVGAEDMLTRLTIFTDEDQLLVTTAMAESLPAINALLAADARAVLRSKLQAHRRGAAQPKVVENIDRMLAEL